MEILLQRKLSLVGYTLTWANSRCLYRMWVNSRWRCFSQFTWEWTNLYGTRAIFKLKDNNSV